MSKVIPFRLAAIAWLPLFSLVTVAQAQTYNAAKDWLTTFPTSASVASASSATWGSGSAWSAGGLSWNWTNEAASPSVPGSLQLIPTYYTPNTVGSLTSGTSGGTVTGTLTYTVPFQAYQYNPGTTYDVAVGQTLTQQFANNHTIVGGTGSTAFTLPAGFSSLGASSGELQEITHVENFASATSVVGFSTTEFNPTGAHFNDGTSGDSSVQDSGPGVFYNYASTNATSSGLGALNAPAGSGDSNGANTFNTLTLGGTWGPSYVAWTAPAGGFVTIHSTIWDTGQTASDGNPSFFVFDTNGGPSAPILSASRWTVSGSNYNGTNFNAAPSSTIPGSTLAQVPDLTGYTGGTNKGLDWQSGLFYVSPGETIYFAIDPNHDYGQSAGLGSRVEGNQDPIALQAIVSFVTPEPSSYVLLGTALAGLAFTTWKRQRQG